MLILGMIRRLVVTSANVAVNSARTRRPKTFCKRFRSARGGRERLRGLGFATHPHIFDL